MRLGHSKLNPPTPARRLLPLALALAALVAFILSLTWTIVQAQVALTGFLNGESLWSKAQKQASIELLNFTVSGDARHYAAFQRSVATLDMYRSARDKAASLDVAFGSAAADFRHNTALPAAIPGSIYLLRYFSGVPCVRDALSLWRATDAPVALLRTTGFAIQSAYAAGRVTPRDIERWREQINQLDGVIGALGNRFSLVTAHGAISAGRVLFVGTAALALTALGLWLVLARRVLARLQASEERYRLLFDNAADAIVVSDIDSGRILDANQTFRAWTGRTLAGDETVHYAELFAHPEGGSNLSGSADLLDPAGNTRPVEIRSSAAIWGRQVVRQAIIRDASERLAGERDRLIAAEALAGIAEGVMIADAERQVLSLNAAAGRMLSMASAQASGRLDDWHGMADGSALPPWIWNEIAAKGHWSGEAEGRRRDGSRYTEHLSISVIRDPRQRVVRHVAVFSDSSVLAADRLRLEYLAAHDALTGLVNHVRFQHLCDQAIMRAVREQGAIAVLLIDLDAFKLVNDGYGHAVGDQLLQMAARRIATVLPEGGVAGRIGGDEFTLLVPVGPNLGDAEDVAANLLAALAQPYHVDLHEILLSASIGIANYPRDGDHARSLMAHAGAAMGVAKREQRNAMRVYAPAMQADAQRRMLLATDMRRALQAGEFRLVYQPIVQMRSGDVIAVEALLRWRHPQRGEIMPGEFIPLAESTGLIHDIDEWVLQAVCMQLRAWEATDMPSIRVAVNISARWFAQAGFVDSVHRTLREQAVAPQRIVLEITEGAILRLGEETAETLRALHALGVGIAIDDFGTGYASMAYLKLPAIEYLKIDGSFVAGLPAGVDDAAITTAILGMASGLGLITIAECIETEAQHEFLLQAGCAEGQGYLYSRPLELPALEQRLGTGRHRSGGTRALVAV